MSQGKLRSDLNNAVSGYNSKQRSRGENGKGMVYNWAEYLERSSKWRKIASENLGLIEGAVYNFPKKKPVPRSELTSQERDDLRDKEVGDLKYDLNFQAKENDKRFLQLKEKNDLLSRELRTTKVAMVRMHRTSAQPIKGKCLILDNVPYDWRDIVRNMIRLEEIDLELYDDVSQLEADVDLIDGYDQLY